MSELGPMSTGGSQNRAPPSPLPDLRRQPGLSPYTGLQHPVVNGAARSSSDPTTTAAGYVTYIYNDKLTFIMTFIMTKSRRPLKALVQVVSEHNTS